MFLDAKGRMENRAVIAWDSRGFLMSETVEFKKEKFTAVTTKDCLAVDDAGNWTELRETAKLIEKGQTIPLSISAVVRVFEYYEVVPPSV